MLTDDTGNEDIVASGRAHANGEAVGVHEESDAALMERLRSDDAMALHRLMRRYWKPLVTHARDIIGDQDAAADAAQRAFIELWQRRARWTATSSASGLLFCMARNAALNERRARLSHAHTEETRGGELTARPCTPLQALEEKELRAALTDALRRLPARRRQVFTLSRDQDRSHLEISSLMGISPQTVANQMTLAMADLRRYLRPVLDAG